MRNIYNEYSFLVLLFALLFTGFLSSCSDSGGSYQEEPRYSGISPEEGASGMTESEEMAVEAPPFTDGIFPCMDCHVDIEPNPERRPLVDMHDDIDAMFHHDSENRWCLDCHDRENRDYLRSASGKLISFDESYKLCGQCHGDKLRDWKAGIHGKRTGQWNGPKHYLLCVHCHNPHSPRFKSMEPMPPPVRQEDIQR